MATKTSTKFSKVMIKGCDKLFKSLNGIKVVLDKFTENGQLSTESLLTDIRARIS